MIDASSAGLSFDFAKEDVRAAVELVEQSEFRASLASAILEGELPLLATADGLAFSVSPSIERLRRVAEMSRAGELLISSDLLASEAGLALKLKRRVGPPTPGEEVVSMEFESGPSSKPEPPDSAPALSRFLPNESPGDALRRLKQEKQRLRADGGPPLCKASLALALGLSRMGRHREAAFEVLDGLAHARRAHDEAGEKACAALLAQLAKLEGDPVSAEAWGKLTH